MRVYVYAFAVTASKVPGAQGGLCAHAGGGILRCARHKRNVTSAEYMKLVGSDDKRDQISTKNLPSSRGLCAVLRS